LKNNSAGEAEAARLLAAAGLLSRDTL
jgi:hypothetical protein